MSYAESDDFPAFYTRKSGFKVGPGVIDMIMMVNQALQSPWSIDDSDAAARILCEDIVWSRSAI